MDSIISIPKLNATNWSHWSESVQNLMLLTETSAVFLLKPPRNKAIILWSSWWSAKLKDSAPHIKTAPRDSPLIILRTITSLSLANRQSNLMEVTQKFWCFKPHKDMTIQIYLKEYLNRYQLVKEHTPITTDVEYHMKYLFLSHINSIQPELAHRCKDFSHQDMISECLKWTSNTTHKNKSSAHKNSVKCNFCGIKGHIEDDCKKKKRLAKEKLGHNEHKKNNVPTINSLDNSTYQLDTAADFHVSGDKSNFSSYSATVQTVRVAGGHQLNTAGHGDLIFPTIDNNIEILPGAIHMPGQIHCILSTAQLEKQGFSIRWPAEYRDVELIRPDGSICAKFQRMSGRLICRPPQLNTNKSQIYSIHRTWHNILGHPGQRAQDAILKSAKIKGYQYDHNCNICTKSKITKRKGHSSLRIASSFGEAIHMDLVGGQKALSPTTTDQSTPNATWFLLAVDEFTSYKWAWPIYSKKTVPTQIRQFLEHLKVKFNKTPKVIHTDSGTEFSNSMLQEELLFRGVEWHKSSSHAPEQNGIVERNVRTVTEKMRALHLQSGLPLRLWPLILNASINILNITPNSIAPESAYYAVFKLLPDIRHLHPFGCRAFWLNPDQNKLESKAKEGIYVGTEFSGGHSILNPETNKVIVRRDIRVHETSFPLRKQILAFHANNRRIVESALSGPKSQEWNKAIDKELENMDHNNVWTLVPRSEAKGRIMTGKWALKEKSDGQLKARWCARGFSEPFADDTYAEVLPPTTMRLLLAYAAANDLYIRHVDITAAFLHTHIDCPIYIEQPHGREKPGDLICKLNKAIYGLKTAPRRWQHKLRQTLDKMGFKPLKTDSNVFRQENTIISTYVDDFMIISKSHKSIINCVTSLANAFQIKDLGEMTKFLGINIEQMPDGIRINQQDKINSLCDDLGMTHCRSANTPIADDNLIDRDTEIMCSHSDAAIYRSAVGVLLHIANMTRPDIQYAVNRLCRYVHNPSQNAYLSLKHLMRYVSGTKSAALFFPKSNRTELTASSDSSWGNTTSPKGTSGIV